MRPLWRRSLYGLATLALAAGVALWVADSFDSQRLQRVASGWMLEQHQRELTFDGPVTLQLWPQPAVTLRRVRLSERGRPQQPFATVDSASLSLRLWPLLADREIEVDSVSARGVTLRFVRDAEGQRNIGDLIERLASVSAPHVGKPLAMDSVKLADVAMEIDDAQAGLHGRLAIAKFDLGAFGPGRVSPLHLQAQAVLSEPPMNAALELDAGLSLRPAAQVGAPPLLQLDKAGMRLRGQGFEVEDLDARLQAESMRLQYGARHGLGDSHVEIDGAQLQFGGTRLGWRIDSGELGLARLRLDILQRTLELDQLALQLKGKRAGTTLDAWLRWPMLKVQGDALQGGALEGQLTLGGDQRLQLQVRSKPPSGAFERISVPGLQLEVDGQVGTSAVKGRAGATLVLAPKPLAVGLDAMSLRLRLDDPALPPLQLALDGQAQLTPSTASGRVQGSINDQRVDARFDARLGRPRPFVDLQASFGTLDLTRFIASERRGAAAAPTLASTPVDLRPLRSADARLRISVARLLRAPYRIDGLELQAQIDNGALELLRFAGSAWGGNFDASGSADAASSRLALRLRADAVDLRAMLADTTGYDGLRGRGRIEADLRSQGATVGAVRAGLNGRLSLALRPAALRGVDLAQALRGWRSASLAGSDTLASDAQRQTEFSQLDGSFELRDGVARNTDLDGRSEFLRVGGEGTVDLASGRLDYLLRARVINTAAGRAGPEMVMLNGVTVPVELHGPFGNVEWQVRWGTVTAAVAALSVPNAALGTVSGVARGATGVLRGAAG
ncbi:MAG: AsmA family protein, partial [Rubrivivax sp.]